MRLRGRCFLGLVVTSVVLSAGEDPAAPAAEMAIPGREWDEAAPESQAVDSQKLKGAFEYLATAAGRDGVKETVVIRNGYLIGEGPAAGRKHVRFQ